MKLRIGTRGSKLALVQTQTVLKKLEKVIPNIDVEVKVIKTAGNSSQKKTGPGMFVKEINQAVLRGDVELGVHSLKDLPTQLPEELDLVCVPERLDPNDVLISRLGKKLYDLPPHSVIGTSSLRRKAEILHLRSDLRIREIRGNIETRIRKMENGLYDGIVVAIAALQRLGLQGLVTQRFELDEVVPAAGQGALAVVCRKGKVQDFLYEINDWCAWREAICERAFLAELDLGCKGSVGAVARAKGENIELIVVLHDEERRLFKLYGKKPLELGKKAGVMLRQVRST